jgi:PAS domain S-box-containing protein
MGRPSFLEAAKGIGGVGLQHLGELIDGAPFGVYLDDPSEGCIYANDTLLGLIGLEWEAFRGFGWARFVVPEDVERVQNAISTYEHNPGAINITYRVRASEDSPIRWVNADARAVLDDQGKHVGTISITRDVTEETEQSSRLVEEQKMEAVGQLAARLAHDLNNLLTALIGNTELLGLEVQSEKGRARLESIDVVFEQAKHLTSQLLTLSSNDVNPMSASELDLELQRLVPVIQSTVGSGVELNLSLGVNQSHVALSFSQLGQIMLNLASNARDAMDGQGTLHLSTMFFEGKLKLTVRDTGTGMDTATMAQAFRPFFTTKANGRGSGLGLTTVRNLVELVSGAVTIEGNAGQGTEVSLILPIVEPLAFPDQHGVKRQPTARTGTVLIVEDNDSVRQGLAYSLALVGYSVVTGASLGEARRRLDRLEHLTAVVSDVLLPDGPGTDLVDEIRQKWPDLPVVFNSGFTGDASVQLSNLQNTNMAFVAKPFRTREILEALDSLRSRSMEGYSEETEQSVG